MKKEVYICPTPILQAQAGRSYPRSAVDLQGKGPQAFMSQTVSGRQGRFPTPVLREPERYLDLRNEVG